jgi:hypothetical protein
LYECRNYCTVSIVVVPSFLGLAITLPSVLILFGAGATFEEIDATKYKIRSIYSIAVPACCT